ncbi:hypothetical protein DCAR_0312959 [Daucus carota subsp. sativus]|uniref:Uncharacterized protein n=1 Tax=Daucus carota subsp. sativus TaxID=79200 RepID=A0A161WVJ9_DAUCS|nr:hypothetical protein DCAR_0312959 [Daucus carota subsp. sativus]
MMLFFVHPKLGERCAFSTLFGKVICLKIEFPRDIISLDIHPPYQLSQHSIIIFAWICQLF